MESLLKPFTTIIIIIFFFLVYSSIFHLSRGEEEDEKFRECSRPYECGEIRNLSYPFWGDDRPYYCGRPGFEVSCEENKSYMKIDHIEFQLLSFSHSDQTSTIRAARVDLLEGPCSSKVKHENTTLSNQYDFFIPYPSTVQNLTLFYCDSPPQAPHLKELASFPHFSCRGDNSKTVFYGTYVLEWTHLLESNNCSVVQVPIFGDALNFESRSFGEDGMKAVGETFKGGFDINYSEFIACGACEASGGKCGNNDSTSLSFSCFCPHGAEPASCPPPRHRGGHWKIKILIGATSAGIVILLICLTISCSRIKTSAIRPTSFWKNITNEDKDLEIFLKNYGQLTVKRYRFSEIKKMTESFKDKLGKGGYGEVYKGKLLDEALVAVKILNAAKGNGQEFINEVASISRTSHVNIVSLLGFCLENGKRALIYEFMPNGSLEKFIYNDCQLQSIPQLAWEKLLQIAIGIARGLEYLHRGCSTRILHFDIKPHNILLDEDLCPKISDFGLAKLCPNKESIVSLLDARGTIGYIAPEVFNRNFGRVSSKSDVYSYGMMILEMVGGRKNIKVEVSQTSEIYFPDWIYEHLQQGSNLGLWGEMTNEENEIARKMTIVGLWCIQTMPSDRPSMGKVIEMLEGSFGALHLPQKPSLFAPRSLERLPTELMAESSTTSMS